MQLFWTFIGALVGGLVGVLANCMILWGLERLYPKGRPVPLASQLRSIRFWLFSAVAGAAFTTAFGVLRGWLPAEPIYTLPLVSWIQASPAPWLAFIIGPLGFAVVYDFFNYWMHRAQHRFFWRLHAIHHSIENLSAVNSYFHPTEELFRIAFITAPMTLLFGVEAAGVTVFSTVLIGAWGYYLHAPVRFNVGRIGRRLLADNLWHRIHHSRESQHFDRNFGTSVTIWDQLFGTAYFPRPDEWPDTGVPGEPEPATVGDFLFGPFRSKSPEAADREIA